VAIGIGLLAGATARGVQIDAVGASSRLPHPVLALLSVAATLALLLWPAALAIRQLTRRQGRRLAPTASICTPVAVAPASRPIAAATTIPSTASRHRSRSIGLRIRRAR